MNFGGMTKKMKNLQENEKMILNELRKNARVSLLEVAKKTNMPVSTVYDKLKGYEKDIIKKHTSLVDFTNLGYYARKIVVLKVSKESRQEIQNFLASHPNVNSLYKINSGYDYLIEIIADNSGKIKDILDELNSQKGILGMSGYDLVDELKREAFVI